ncbi:uncharacterized protein LOC115624044 isoform X2 [Scaptodrosophila lebanonensis]|uniref:Uncharacterized protein LOC115624044 isoform X2 n=1 Tax=Drosophila lebanonensis TaxID=7225 RepID=A0A6J2THA1_DROLE|nr:uncharacterized protein LOC115624044 isoform X2 [Scaptodrosophila lebanonensis]
MDNPSEESLDLDDFLGDVDVDAERLTAMLRKQAAKQLRQPRNQRVFGDLDLDLDFDVHFTKRDKAQGTTNTGTKSPLRESGNNQNAINGLIPAAASPEAAATAPARAIASAEPQSPVHENLPPRTLSLSPRSSSQNSRSARNSVRRSGGAAVSDQLRRVAIRRRSQSHGRRQLLKEFDDLTPSLSTSPSSGSFQPAVSSTPSSQPHRTEPASLLPEAVQLRQQHEENFQQNFPTLDRVGSVCPLPPSGSPRSITPTSHTTPSSMHRSAASESSIRRTYTIEKGPMPGQLLLSPSAATSQEILHESRQPVVRVRRTADLLYRSASHQTIRVNTPDRQMVLESPCRSVHLEPEVVVPETQEPGTENAPVNQTARLIQDISRSTNAPMVVIPISCNGHAPVASVESMKSASPKVKNAQSMAVQTAAVNESVGPCTNRSVQTSNDQPMENLDQIMTDDDSDEDRTSRQSDAMVSGQTDKSVPLNLAPSGGNTTRQRRLRKRNYRAPVLDSTTQLLNLHQNGKRRTQNPKTQLPLNKPPNAPINGEQFAEELVRMSNYEILDLRKRNSLGKVVMPLNGQRTHMEEERCRERQLVLEQQIQWEILRRNLEGKGEGLPAIPSDPIEFTETELDEYQSPEELHPVRQTQNEQQAADEEQSALRQQIVTEKQTTEMAPPADFRDKSRVNAEKSVRQTRSSELSKTKRRSRSRRGNAPMTKELEHYLSLSQTINDRRKAKSNSKRLLYNKGDSETEDRDGSSPEKQMRVTDLEIAPEPPAQRSFSGSLDHIHIVPPPPSPPLMRRQSQSMRELRRSARVTELDVVVHDLNEEDDVLASPPSQFATRSSRTRNNSKLVVDTSKSQRRSKRRVEAEPEISEDELPNTPPREFAPSPIYEMRDDEVIVEVVATPPARFQTQRRESMKDMEALRMETPTPPAAPGAQPIESRRSNNEQPSTSKAARQVLEQSRIASVVPAPTLPSPDDAIFKKPLAPAPRRKQINKSQLERQMDKLRMSHLVNATLKDSETSGKEDSSVRRSKRGHVPLKNTWIHTVVNPLKLGFLGNQSIVVNKAKTKKPRKEVQQRTEDGSLFFRLPLSSSTPINVPVSTNTHPTSDASTAKQMAAAHQTADSEAISAFSGLGDTNTYTSGIEPLPETADEQQQEERQQEQETPVSKSSEKKINTKQTAVVAPKKRSRKKNVQELPKQPAIEQVEEQKKVPKKAGRKKKTQVDPENQAVEEEQERQQMNTDELVPSPPLSPTTSEMVSSAAAEGAVAASPAFTEDDEQQAASARLMAWLRGASETQPGDTANWTATDFKTMHLSSVGSLVFTSLEGVDFAFYDTEQKACLGYMRLKPLQERSAKRAKSYTLHFVLLHGQVAVDSTAAGVEETENSVLGPGDMVEINKGTRYSIRNLVNTVSLLMVFRR